MGSEPFIVTEWLIMDFYRGMIRFAFVNLFSTFKDSEHFIYFCDDYWLDSFHGCVFNILKIFVHFRTFSTE